MQVRGTDGLAMRQSYVLDGLSRVREILGGNSQNSLINYDLEDRLSQVTDPRGGVYHYSLDALGRLISAATPENATTAMSWRDDNSLSSVTDPLTLTTSYTRNGFGDVISMTSPDTGTTTFTVDAAGRTTSRTDARGVVTNYTYDGAGRLLSQTYPAKAADNVTYTYDTRGWLISVDDRPGATAYGYSTRGNILSVTKQLGGRTYASAYTYDKADNAMSMTYPSGRGVTYTRDDAGRIASISMSGDGPSNAVLSQITYNALGQIIAATYGNSASLSRVYDASGRLRNHIVNGPVSPIQALTFTYDQLDNIRSMDDGIDADRSQALRYDGLSRLKLAAGAYGTVQYRHDAAGNRRRVFSDDFTGTRGAFDDRYSLHPGTHRLRRINQVTDGTWRRFIYRDSGQVTREFQGASIVTNNIERFAHDSEGRVVRVYEGPPSAVDQLVAVYGYDASGLRVRKTVHGGAAANPDSGTLHFIYDLQGRLLAEYDAGAGNALLREYIYLGLMPVALVSYDGAGVGTVSYLHTDQVNRVQKATDASGAIVYDTLYTPFGVTISSTGTLVQALRFPGQRADAETGLSQNWHRDYDPTLGRYVQSDPIGLAGGLNTYAYVGNNPMGAVDPTGLDFKPEGTLENGQVIGDIPGSIFWIADLPPINGEARIICGCGELPEGPVDVDFLYDPREEKSLRWTKLVSGNFEIGNSGGNGRGVSPAHGRVISVGLRPVLGAFTGYGVLNRQGSPQNYLRDLSSGIVLSVGGSCKGLGGNPAP